MNKYSIDNHPEITGTIHFNEQKDGYNKEQVDLYIKELSDAYNTMYSKYASKNQDNIENKADAIGKALLKAEISAKQTMDEAKEEAEHLLTDAKLKVNKIFQIVEETKKSMDMLFRIVRDAKTETEIVCQKNSQISDNTTTHKEEGPILQVDN